MAFMYSNYFQEVFGHYADQNRSLKRRKAAQRKEFVAPGQNITEAYTADLVVPESFCSLFRIKLETRLSSCI